MFTLELIKKAFLAFCNLVTKPVCVWSTGTNRKTESYAYVGVCLHARVLRSLLDPGPECADYQPLQWVSSAGGGCGAATRGPAPGHCGGKDTHTHNSIKKLTLHFQYNNLIHTAVL